MASSNPVTELHQKKTVGVSVTEAELPVPKERRTEELVIALVGPVASGCTKAKEILKSVLEEQYGYKVTSHKPSVIIEKSAELISITIEKDLKGIEISKVSKPAYCIENDFDALLKITDTRTTAEKAECAKLMQIKARAPISNELLARYSAGMDNELYRAIEALRRQQEFRFRNGNVVDSNDEAD